MQKGSSAQHPNARDILAEADRARKELQNYLRHMNISLNGLAKQLNVSQSTLHRFQEGRIRKVTKTIRPVVEFVHKEIENMQNQMGMPADPDLREKIWEAAGSSPEAARIIIEVIEALGPVLARHPALSRNQGKG